MDITVTSGGLFDTPTNIDRVDDGTITLSFEDCNSGTVDYDIPSIGQQGSIPIQRIADDKVALCEALNAQELHLQATRAILSLKAPQFRS